MEGLLTTEELANMLKVHKSWVYVRTRETGPGSMPRINVGKYLRFDKTKVNEWLKKQRRGDWS